MNEAIGLDGEEIGAVRDLEAMKGSREGDERLLKGSWNAFLGIRHQFPLKSTNIILSIFCFYNM